MVRFPLKSARKLLPQALIWLLIIAVTTSTFFVYWITQEQSRLVEQERQTYFQQLMSEYSLIFTYSYQYLDERSLQPYFLSLLRYDGIDAVKAQFNNGIIIEESKLTTPASNWSLQAPIYQSLNSNETIGQFYLSVNTEFQDSHLGQLKKNLILLFVCIWTILAALITTFLHKKITSRLSLISSQLDNLQDNDLDESTTPIGLTFEKQPKNEVDDVMLSVIRIWRMSRVSSRFNKRQFGSLTKQQENNEQLIERQSEIIEGHILHLKETQHQQQAVLDSLPLRIFWKDKEGAYLGANRLYLQDMGCDMAALIGHKDNDFSWQKRAQLTMADDRSVMESGKGQHDFKENILLHNNTCEWVIKSKLPLFSLEKSSEAPSEQKIIGMIGFYQHIENSQPVDLDKNDEHS